MAFLFEVCRFYLRAKQKVVMQSRDKSKALLGKETQVLKKNSHYSKKTDNWTGGRLSEKY